MSQVLSKFVISSVLAISVFASQAADAGHAGYEHKHKHNMIFFDTAKANLKHNASPAIARAIEMMANNPNGVMCLVGHADKRGTRPYNLDLSERRAEAVKKFLQECSEDYRYRFVVLGAGEDHPMFSGDGPAVLQKNRNVTISIVNSPDECTLE